MDDDFILKNAKNKLNSFKNSFSNQGIKDNVIQILSILHNNKEDDILKAKF